MLKRLFVCVRVCVCFRWVWVGVSIPCILQSWNFLLLFLFLPYQYATNEAQKMKDFIANTQPKTKAPDTKRMPHIKASIFLPVSAIRLLDGALQVIVF